MQKFKRFETVCWMALASLVGAAYCREASWPLLISADGVDYMNQAAHIVRGELTESSERPTGYAFVLAALHALGADTEMGVICVNLAAIAIACACSWTLLVRDFQLTYSEAMPVMLLSLAGPCLGSPIWAMTEPSYFAASLTAIVCLDQFTRSQRLAWFLTALPCIGAAVALRTAGLSLGAALVAALYLRLRSHIGWRTIVTVSAGAAVGAAMLVLRSAQYPSIGLGQYRNSYGSPLNAVYVLSHIRLRVLGELVAHCTRFDLPLVYREELTLLGVLVLGIMGLGAWTLRRHLTPLTAYLAAYSVATIAWPFVEQRFWIPTAPFMIAVAFMGLREIGRRSRSLAACGRPLLRAYVCAYVILSCVNARAPVKTVPSWTDESFAALRALP